MSIILKKANTLHSRKRQSENGLMSPVGEAIGLVFTPSKKEKQKLPNKTQMAKSSLGELKQSRKLAIQKHMRQLVAKRRLIKAIRTVYLVSMFLSIAKQSNYQNQLLTHKFKKRSWLIYPEDWIKKIWDIFMLIVLVYSSFYIPYVAAFEDDANVYQVTKFVLSSIYVLDIGLLLRMCYYDSNNNLVQDQLQIFFNYSTGWLIIDVISAIPYSEFQLFKILRIGRVQKIISSSSLNQNKILQLILDFLDLKQAYLLQILFFSFIGFHYATCLWALSIEYSGGNTPNYLDAAYWAMQTLSTSGYGDVLPQSTLEFLQAILAMICGAMFMSLVIGNLGSILLDMDAESQFHKINCHYKELFNIVTIFPEYQREIINFLVTNHKHNHSWTLSQQEWFTILPINMQNNIILFAARKEILSVSTFKVSVAFALKVMRQISFMKAKAGQLIWLKGDPVEEIYFLIEGTIQYRNQYGKEMLEIKRGAVFGEQEFFNKKQIVQISQQRKSYAYAKVDCYYLIIKSQYFFRHLQEFSALQKYLSILAQHRLGDMFIRSKQYQLENAKERENQQRLELIKSANNIEVKEYHGMIKHRQTVIYDTRSSNTESILDRLLSNRTTKLQMLMERFRKVVSMIIFANRTINRQLLSSKSTSVQNSQTNLFSKVVKPNQIVPLGILLKMKQKFVQIKKLQKISLLKKNKFKAIISGFASTHIPSPSTSESKYGITSERKKTYFQHEIQKDLDEKLTQLKVLEKNVGLSQWLVSANQSDLEAEILSIQKLMEKIDLSRLGQSL